MAEKDATPPPTTATVSGGRSPAAKSIRMTSTATASKETTHARPEAPERSPSAQSDVAAQEVEAGLFAEADDVEAVCLWSNAKREKLIDTRTTHTPTLLLAPINLTRLLSPRAFSKA